MKIAADTTTKDPRQLYISLRDDLHISIQYFQGKPCYLIEDPQEIQFFRVGIDEGTFISMLDGKTSLDEALRQSAASASQDAISEQEAMQIILWLLDAKLAHTSGTISLDREKKSDNPTKKSGFNPLAIRIPLAHPDSFFTTALPWCAWIFEPAAFGVWVCACLAALSHFFSNWAAFSGELESIVAPRNWPSLMIAWVFLKVLHECAHGLVCKKYGGIVPETGIMILWGMPVPYVDVTSSWGFRGKKQRIYTALAGIYAEVFVAALAMLVWSHTGPGWLHYWCMHITIIAGVSSVIFNINPLMRFDGYYVLMDMLEIPNLYGFGQQFWRSVRGKILAGVPVVFPGDTGRQRQIIACYGLLAAIWRIIIYISLTLVALALFPFDESHLIWCILAIFTVLALWRFGKNYSQPSPREKPSLVRHIVVASAGCLLLGLLLLYVATPFRLTAPAIVEYKPLIVVRNYSPGFVQEIDVSSGQSVHKGQIIAKLTNDELDYQLADLEWELEICRLNIRTMQHKEDIGAIKAEEQKLADLKKQHEEKFEQISRLVIRASEPGIILTRQPESLVGKYLSGGSEVVSLGNEDLKEICVSLEQDDADAFFAQVGKPVWMRIGGSVLLSALSRIDPRASLEPFHPALAATKGGPLPVQRKPDDSPDKKDDSSREKFELLAPQFTGRIALSSDLSTELAAGQRVQVSFVPEGQSMGNYIVTPIPTLVPR